MLTEKTKTKKMNLERHYHHRIVETYCKHHREKTIPKNCEWISSDVITFKLVYWALKNVCALTDYKMSDFKINKRSIIYNKPKQRR